MAVKQMLVDHAESSSTTDARLQLLLRQHEIASRNGLKREEICITMVIGLGSCTVPEDPTKFKKFIVDLLKVEDLLKQECANLELLCATLRALYNEISDANKTPLSPAMSIVLRLISSDMIPDAVKWILTSGYKPASLERALSNLCQWLTKWTYTPNLKPLVISLIDALLEDHPDIVLKVTLNYIEALFKLLIIPDFRINVGNVVFYMLCNVRKIEVYEKIVSHIPKIVEFLQRENSEDSLMYVKEIYDMCSSLKIVCPKYEAVEAQLETLINMHNCNNEELGNSPKITEIVQGSGNKVGLNNLGNTCYMNSVLQALYMTRQFRNNIIMYEHSGSPLYHNIQDLFALLRYSTRLSHSPSDVLRCARPSTFYHGDQHDSSEFLLHLLDILHEQEVKELKELDQPSTSNDSNTVPNTMVEQSFGGRSMTVFTCGQCSSHSEKIDDFRELPLCFPDETEDMYSINPSVSSLLDYYLQPEKLCGDNKYHCEKCGLIDGEKVTRVIQAPRRLIMTLKHFKYDVNTFKRTKLLQRVKLEEYIQLNDIGYELYAVIVHFGSSIDHGHYYAFAKEDDQWYKFNDDLVHTLDHSQVYEMQPPESPYILFYRSQQSEEPEDLQITDLPSRIQEIVQKDLADAKEEDERRKRPLIAYKTRHINENDDPPPPPSCGDAFSNSPSMFVF